MFGLLVCEENDLLKVKSVDNLVLVYGFIDDGVKIAVLVLEQQTCFCSIEFCRKAYMMRGEKCKERITCFYIES